MSFLDLIEPVFKFLPEIKSPEVQPALNKKIMWSALALVIFFVMGNISVIGIDLAASAGGRLETLQIILASKIGTLITVGIGPIVLASIILQLIVGAGILNIDLTEPRDKTRFSSLQKLFAIILCFFEAAVYVLSGFLVPVEGMFLWVVIQVAFGSIILLYLDEVVSKHGIGSGISLFIAGGVAGSVFWQIFNPTHISDVITGTVALDIFNADGLIFLFFREVGTNLFNASTTYLLPILFTIIVFLVVVFVEGMHINIPITMGRRGTGGRFPVKFLYVSNIPVILAVALFANVQLWAALAKDVPFIGSIIGVIAALVNTQNLYGLFPKFLLQVSPLILEQIVQSILSLQFIGLGGDIIHAFIYIAILTAVCVVFGRFWVEMAGQGPEAISNQLQKSGMFIPGFRRDPRIVRKVLDRYIPPISIMGSAFVGLLAGFADLTGALGSGTGILLTVGIVYRLYEELAKSQLMEMHPMLGRLLG